MMGLRQYVTIVEENFIQLETQSQANTPLTPSEPEGSKGKGKRHSGGLITNRKLIPIATPRGRKPLNYASIQGKQTLITCKGNITIINPVVTSKGRFLKALDNTFLQGTVRGTLESQGNSQRTERACPEPKRPAGGHLGHSYGWKEIEENHTHSFIHLPIQQKPQTRGLEGYGSSSSDPPITQISFPIKHGQQKVQPRIPLGRTLSKFPEDMSERDTLQRTYGNY
ncbi:hypothetical protein O181_103183 [Austropuccinia psidii MF-1]|uniref:Uncharacterized protein n=1 Tax=Austropuccinia psidii MF-1 TaxID=1389203 RepID=A0A9Q3JHR4_9BASI|nr:hypothetical protein [Austropuccinia psidii MF-1]